MNEFRLKGLSHEKRLYRIILEYIPQILAVINGNFQMICPDCLSFLMQNMFLIWWGCKKCRVQSCRTGHATFVYHRVNDNATFVYHHVNDNATFVYYRVNDNSTFVYHGVSDNATFVYHRVNDNTTFVYHGVNDNATFVYHPVNDKATFVYHGVNDNATFVYHRVNDNATSVYHGGNVLELLWHEKKKKFKSSVPKLGMPECT